ncbi:UNVERIFIED_CONTAM: hypothetical protein FKN15_064022 [Acipenser sinensis]
MLQLQGIESGKPCLLGISGWCTGGVLLLLLRWGDKLERKEHRSETTVNGGEPETVLSGCSTRLREREREREREKHNCDVFHSISWTAVALVRALRPSTHRNPGQINHNLTSYPGPSEEDAALAVVTAGTYRHDRKVELEGTVLLRTTGTGTYRQFHQGHLGHNKWPNEPYQDTTADTPG